MYTYNYLNADSNKSSDKIYQNFQTFHNFQNFQSEDEDNRQILNIDDKQLRLDILLYIKQFKNTYYKYTNKSRFNPELYNTFIKDDQFDGGATAYDDDDDIRIFDKYILEYIRYRNDVITYIQCKNKEIVIKTKLEDLTDMTPAIDTVDVLFVIDMNEKDMFTYCYSLLQKSGNILMIKNIVFSIILKYQGEYIRMKLSAFNKNKNTHPYLILERFFS